MARSFESDRVAEMAAICQKLSYRRCDLIEGKTVLAETPGVFLHASGDIGGNPAALKPLCWCQFRGSLGSQSPSSFTPASRSTTSLRHAALAQFAARLRNGPYPLSAPRASVQLGEPGFDRAGAPQASCSKAGSMRSAG
ncbi:MAG: hypothetical protein U5O69_06375 [Candidatus Competibacteraceae bacterium]|nr:hypothetical protein [Candidatus Competibacteraceae bacterium]